MNVISANILSINTKVFFSIDLLSSNTVLEEVMELKKKFANDLLFPSHLLGPEIAVPLVQSSISGATACLGGKGGNIFCRSLRVC